MRRLLIVPILSGWFCATAERAHAHSVELQWSAPNECGSAIGLQNRVDVLLNRPPLPQPFHASVRIVRAEGGYNAQLRTESGGRRALSAPDCMELLEAIAVVLALAIDPRSQTPPTAASPMSTPALTCLASAGVAIDSGTLPRLTAGIQLGFEVLNDWASIGLLGTYYLSRSKSAPDRADAGGEFAFWTVGVPGCWNGGSSERRVELCVAPEVGRIYGSGYGVDVPQEASALWAAVVLGPALRLQLASHAALRIGAGAAVTVSGHQPFVVEGLGTVHQANRVSARGSINYNLIF